MTGTLAAVTPTVEEIDEQLVCTQILDLTHDVKSFVLEPVEAQFVRFDPGQYLTVTVEVGGAELERCYTISSPPTRPGVTITVKRVPGGPVSNRLHDALAVGDTLRVAGPLGRFSTTHHPAAKYLFLSAGSGITPLMSMTRTLHDRGEPTDLVFLHSARTPRDIIFRDELEIVASRRGVYVHAICEADSATERWSGPSGRLTLPMLLDLTPDLHDREIFVCGPPPYMRSVRDMLELAGTDPARRHEETFVLGTPMPHPAPPDRTGSATSRAEQFTIEFRRSRRKIECSSDDTILAAAQRAGLGLPSSCGEGLCGTCKSTLLDGRVDMTHAGGIRPRETAQNKILICCSTPRENLIIDA